MSEHDTLLDATTRRAIATYSMLGYVGYLFRELMAYVELLEEEIAKGETKKDKPC